ncbi:MAG: polysaccharide biosynthesis/export family protein [Saprospiraceae bacterium]
MDLLFRSKGILFLLPFFAFSCVAPKELTYFQTEEGQEWQQVQTITNAIEVVIQPGDQLVIIVSSFDPMAVAPFNRDNGNYSRDGNAGGFARNRQNTYRVDQQGNIDFPVIGSMNLNELSLDEAEGILRAQINNYVKDPVVSIEFSSLGDCSGRSR